MQKRQLGGVQRERGSGHVLGRPRRAAAVPTGNRFRLPATALADCMSALCIEKRCPIIRAPCSIGANPRLRPTSVAPMIAAIRPRRPARAARPGEIAPPLDHPWTTPARHPVGKKLNEIKALVTDARISPEKYPDLKKLVRWKISRPGKLPMNGRRRRCRTARKSPGSICGGGASPWC
jgi:hypothetical protein